MNKTKVKTGNSVFDEFYPRIKAFLMNNTKTYFIDGKIVMGYKCPDGDMLWLRDHTHQIKAYKYWEIDMKSLVNYFLKKQLPDASFYDYIVKENGRSSFKHVRIDNEADVEYHMVDAVHKIWQVTGDDEWMVSHLEQLEKGLNYSMNDPKRWSKEYNLVKRPFTIDTWDFEYLPGQKPKPLPRTIDKRTKFCIMHGDNSGVYQGCRLLAKMFDYKGNINKMDYWNNKAKELKINVNKICWNGKFYTHQVHIDSIDVPGVDESKQLSLSNPYDINRGIASHEQAVSIIKEYQRRKETVDSFAEWFSIDPVFPFNFAGIKSGPWWSIDAGNYVNGGIMPLVGGELAKASFDHGFEEYGFDILRRYEKMIRNTGESYLWYYRDGRPGFSSPATCPTGGWGSAAMLYAFMEGLAGIMDESKLFQKVKLSPRWIVTEEKDVEVRVEYDTTRAFFGYKYFIDEDKKIISIKPEGSYKEIVYHILLPKGTEAIEVSEGENQIKFSNEAIEKSIYVNFLSRRKDKEIEIIWRELPLE